VNNGIFAQDVYDKIGSDNGLPRGISSLNSVPTPYNYPGDDQSRIDKNSVVFVVDTRYGTNTSATIPSFSSIGNLAINWGDGIIRPYSLGVQYNYVNHGVYIVEINGLIGNFGNISAADPNRLKIIKCLSFGSTLSSLAFAFSNASNIGLPNLIQVPNSIPEKCTSLTRCFVGCSQINDTNIRNWDTKNITNMNSIFNGATLFNQDISSWDVSNVTDMSFAFLGSRFNQPIGNWNVSKVTSFSVMFNGSSFNQDISNWDTSSVTNMANMFGNCPFNQPIGNWNVSKVTSFISLFFQSNNAGLFNQDLSSWTINTRVGETVNMSNMFRGCASFNNGASSGINNWNTTNVTDTSNMFTACLAFNQPLNNWNTSNITNMSSMFQLATSFNQSLDNWNVRKVTSFSSMFQGATSFNGSLSGWAPGADTAGANCSSMFNGATNFTGIGLGTWNTSGVTNTNNMFFGANSFNQDIGSWNVSAVTNMSFMFSNNTVIASGFNNGNSPSISGWNTGNVTNMSFMFANRSNFNQPIGSWNVSKVTTMSNMFQNSIGFNQPLTNWNLASLSSNTALDGFMLNKIGVNAISTANYDALLIGWNNNKASGVNGVANWRTDLRPDFGGAKYTAGGAAATARAALVSYGWTITDGGVA
jgi:surface protein